MRLKFLLLSSCLGAVLAKKVREAGIDDWPLGKVGSLMLSFVAIRYFSRHAVLPDSNLSLPLPMLRSSMFAPGATKSFLDAGPARVMPDLRQTYEGVSPALALERNNGYEPHREEVRVYHPALGPSVIYTENAIMARSLLSPTFIHNSAATRMARVSTMANTNLPRFGGTVDLWA